jgi:hypothetical protein
VVLMGPPPPQHTNFDIATNIPLILRVPGLTDQPSFRTRISTSFMELVDVPSSPRHHYHDQNSQLTEIYVSTF